jgi:hypothetical protein
MVVESTIETLEHLPSKLTLISLNQPSTLTSISLKIFLVNVKNACTTIQSVHALYQIKNCKTLFFDIQANKRSSNPKVSTLSIKKGSI